MTGHSRTTIARWLERAATAAACFNHRLPRDFDVIELQADARCTFIGSKRRTLWLFATIEVCSRLWAGSVLGRRSHRNTKAAINDVILRGRLVGCPLIATDGFEYYVGVMVRLLGSACVYGQVLKTRRNNRVVRVERRVKIGTASRLNAALLASEDSETLNTSFIERLNLTIRQGSAYLRRRSPCHARGADQLRGHVELLRCYYHVHSAAPGVEVRARDQDAGDAGLSGEPALGVARHLHGGRSHATYLCGVVARTVTGPHDAHRQDPHLSRRYDTGRPRAVIRLRIAQPRTTSLPCPAGLRARRPSPIMDVSRKHVCSTRP